MCDLRSTIDVHYNTPEILQKYVWPPYNFRNTIILQQYYRMFDPHATIWKVSITKTGPQVSTRCCHTVATWTSNTFGPQSFHDCSLCLYSKARCLDENDFHSSETCVANAAVSKLTLPGVPPSLSPQLPSSPSSPFVNISKYAAKHSMWAQPGASLDIAPFLHNSYLTAMCEHCAVRFLSQNKELFQLLILFTSLLSLRLIFIELTRFLWQVWCMTQRMTHA